MKTVNEVLAILDGIDKTETESEAGWWETSTGAEFGASVLKEISTATEKLAADAEKWREYKARKDAVIAAGMGRNPLRETATCDTYGVINEDGEVEYSAYWPEACHEHIKDMQIDHGMGGKWKVRALKYLPVTTPRK